MGRETGDASASSMDTSLLYTMLQGLPLCNGARPVARHGWWLPGRRSEEKLGCIVQKESGAAADAQLRVPRFANPCVDVDIRDPQLLFSEFPHEVIL